MERRDFIRMTGLGAAGMALASGKLVRASGKPGLKAIDIQHYLRTIIEVKEPSVDRIIIGDPETPVKKIGTAWMPYWKTLKEAKNTGVNVMVVHEPTFYTHWDLDATQWDYLDAPSPAKENYIKQRELKKKWILDNEIVIIRCHDVLDKVPVWGIPYAFGQGLGFTNDQIIRSKTYYNVYGIETAPAGVIARKIASKLKALNQPGIEFYGDEDYPVSSVGIGTGTICNPLDYSELKPDLFIGIDDTIRTWVQGEYATDTGQPLIVVNHGTSEDLGAKSVGEHLKTIYPDYEIIHFSEGCGYKWITA